MAQHAILLIFFVDSAVFMLKCFFCVILYFPDIFAYRSDFLKKVEFF